MQVLRSFHILKIHLKCISMGQSSQARYPLISGDVNQESCQHRHTWLFFSQKPAIFPPNEESMPSSGWVFLPGKIFHGDQRDP